ESREVDAGLNLVLISYPFDQVPITDIALIKPHAGVNSRAMAAGKIIDHHHGFALRGQHLDSNAADVPRAASHQNRHCESLLLLTRLACSTSCVLNHAQTEGRTPAGDVRPGSRMIASVYLTSVSTGSIGLLG